MRSSSAPDLALHLGEVEPLLEAVDASLSDSEEICEVVVDELTAPRKHPSTLAEEVANCLDALHAAQAAIPELQKPRVLRQYLYISLFATAIVAAVAAPSALFGALFNDIYHTDEELRRDANARLAYLHKMDDEVVSKLEAHKASIMPQWAQLFAIIKPYLERWYALDADGKNCEFSTSDPEKMVSVTFEDLYPTLCEAVTWTQNSDACYLAAYHGCAQITAHPELSDPIQDFEQHRDNARSTRRNIFRDIRREEDRLNNDFPGEHWSLIPTVITAGVAAAAAIVGAIAIWRHRVSKENYQADLNSTHKINACLTDAAAANKLVNVLCKLDLKIIDATTVEQLVERLEMKAAEIEARAQIRTAFLLGSRDPNAGNYGLFHIGKDRVRNKDIAKIILEKAGLGSAAYNNYKLR